MFDRKRCLKYNNFEIDWLKRQKNEYFRYCHEKKPVAAYIPAAIKDPTAAPVLCSFGISNKCEPRMPKYAKYKSTGTATTLSKPQAVSPAILPLITLLSLSKHYSNQKNNLSTVRPASLKFVNWNWIDTPLWNEHEPNIDKRIETLLIRIDVHWWPKLQHNTWTITT